jgi:hypothetical protein
MIPRLILAAALVLPATGCAAGIQTGFEELHPAAAPVIAERVAVLPVTAEPGSESYRDVIADSLLSAAERAHPWIEFISPDVAVDELNDAGLAERVADALVAYDQTGIYDRDLLREVGEALQVDHVLQLRVGYERRSEAGGSLLDPGTVYEADRQNLYVSAALWDVRDGALAWEASGTSTTRDAEYELPRSFTEVLAVTASLLAEQIPLASAEPPVVEEPAGGG